jgi:hypothetical protein
MAVSTAGWYIPRPRNVSRTCPARKKAENTLSGRELSAKAMYDGTKLAYGFVNIISDAPSVHLVVLELRSSRVGSIPQITGSSSLFAHIYKDYSANRSSDPHRYMIGN